MKIVEAQKTLAIRPTQRALFFRTFLPWQLVRFLLINLRMTVMIVKSHGRYIAPKETKER